MQTLRIRDEQGRTSVVRMKQVIMAIASYEENLLGGSWTVIIWVDKGDGFRETYDTEKEALARLDEIEQKLYEMK